MFGSTCWMAIAAGYGFVLDIRLGLSSMACFLVAFGSGMVLWTQRRRLRAHRGLQAFLATGFLTSLGLLLAWDLTGHLGRIIPQASHPRLAYLLLLLFPGLMLQFWLRQRSVESS